MIEVGQREEKFGRDSEWGASEELEGGMRTVGYRVLGAEREVKGTRQNLSTVLFRPGS